MLWYLSLIDGTMTLFQISFGFDPSGIDRCFIHTEYKLLRSFGRYSTQFFRRNFSFGLDAAATSSKQNCFFMTDGSEMPWADE
jgi:hypothetical protein